MKEELIKLSQEKGFLSKNRVVSTEELPFYLWMCELQKWLRDKHSVWIYIKPEGIGSDEWVFIYAITYLPIEFENEKRRIGYFKYVDSFSIGGSCYDGGWETHEEALEQSLLKSLTLI